MITFFESFKDAADGIFVVDEDLRIVFLNEAAQSKLGFNNDDAIGRFCYQLLQGCDERRRLICRDRCRLLELALKSKPVPNHDLLVKTKLGERIWVNMSVFTLKTLESDGKKMIVHLFHKLENKKINEKLLNHLVDVVERYQYSRFNSEVEMEPGLDSLTQRENEILTMVADGYNSADIGELLSISQNTVRNHVQHILQKFNVHTRLEAVTYAIRNDLINI